MLSNHQSILFDFRHSAKACDWQTITDTVMGGHSNAQVLLDQSGALCFHGQVKLTERGGFASIRCTPHRISLHGWHGLLLRVRGDGKRYHLRLRPNADMDGLSYHAAFQALQEWTDYFLLFEEFVPMFRQWRVNGAPPLPLGHIYSLGFVITDGQGGDFSLHVERIALFQR
jgi:monofunctional biosynthetic peptidoglycan transglycosylase